MTGENLVSSACGRMNAKAVLTETIKRKSIQIEALEVLRDQIDWEKLTEKQEEVLWSFFIKSS